MRVLVIGSSGFVGSNLNLEFPDIDFYGLDIREPRVSSDSRYFHCEQLDFLGSEAVLYIKQVNPEFIVLLAGIQFSSPIQKRRNRVKSFAENEKLAHRASEVMKAVPSVKKLIFVSTDMIYGIQCAEIINEEFQPNPIGEYGLSKLKAEEILREFESRTVIFRPRLIVGPGRGGTIKLISRFLSANLPIPFIGNGENKYQMISVFDLWSAIGKCFTLEIQGIFNIGSNEPPTLNKLFPKVLENLHKKNKIIRLPRKLTEKILLALDSLDLSPLAPEQFLIAGQSCVLSTDKFKNQTGWDPRYSDEEIITQAFQELL